MSAGGILRWRRNGCSVIGGDSVLGGCGHHECQQVKEVRVIRICSSCIVVMMRALCLW